MTAHLISQNDAEQEIADLFSPGRWDLAVKEQRAFSGQWLPLGTITVTSEAAPRDRVDVVREGAFEWSLPDVTEAQHSLVGLLGVKEGDDKVRRALDQVATIAVRVGLLHPIFDPAAIEQMPLRRPTTVVSDTSGALQGALDFVARHLHPTARVKIPSIVQMEVANFSHRFFSIRRRAAKRHRVDELIEHMKSQGGQRALVRLELQDDVEIERTYLLGDPLRSAFQPDQDQHLRQLNISVPLRAYVDRLVLEAVRLHQAQSERGHHVLLLTSDQGLALMTLGEGATPLHFRAVQADALFGKHLMGRPLDPFTGESRPISLASLLWELATAFGSARLQQDDRKWTVCALTEDRPWFPFHSMDDLLWREECEAKAVASPVVRAVRERGDVDVRSATKREAEKAGRTEPKPVSFQRLNVSSLLSLICSLDDSQQLDEAEVIRLVGSRYSAGHYRRFLASAGLITVEDARWTANRALVPVSVALRDEDPRKLRDCLLHAPSFAEFSTRTKQSQLGQPLDLSDLRQSAKTYRVLGEMTLLCASIGKDKTYSTPATPELSLFAAIALDRFRAIERGDGLVPTGRWLESLIRDDGIHPEVARRLLELASEEGLLHRSTEGSTTQTQFDDHVVHVLRVLGGRPVAMPIHLYRGDFLIPDKASVSLRIEEVRP